MHASDLSRATMAQEQLQQRDRRELCRDRGAKPPPADEHDIAVRDSKDPDGPVLAFTADRVA